MIRGDIGVGWVYRSSGVGGMRGYMGRVDGVKYIMH